MQCWVFEDELIVVTEPLLENTSETVSVILVVNVWLMGLVERIEDEEVVVVQETSVLEDSGGS